MSRQSSDGLTVAEGLLPLLDISIMLLGLFVILMATGKLQSESKADDSTIAGIGQVVVLRITPRGDMFLQDGASDPQSRQSVTMADLQSTLRALRQKRAEKKTLVLIYYEDVWSTGGPDFSRLKQGIWDSGCVWARIY